MNKSARRQGWKHAISYCAGGAQYRIHGPSSLMVSKERTAIGPIWHHPNGKTRHFGKIQRALLWACELRRIRLAFGVEPFDDIGKTMANILHQERPRDIVFAYRVIAKDIHDAAPCGFKGI